MRSIKEWKIWWKASIGKYDVNDRDVLRWIERKDIPMLNYVLYKGNKSQIKKVLELANLKDILLKTAKLKQLLSSSDQHIASQAKENLQRRGLLE